MDSPQLSIWRIGRLWKELELFVWTWSFFGSKFACRRLADWHAAARISDGSLTFSKIPFPWGSQGTMPSWEAHFQAFLVTGGILIG